MSSICSSDAHLAEITRSAWEHFCMLTGSTVGTHPSYSTLTGVIIVAIHTSSVVLTCYTNTVVNAWKIATWWSITRKHILLLH